jgi:hypothetical protein
MTQWRVFDDVLLIDLLGALGVLGLPLVLGDVAV